MITRTEHDDIYRESARRQSIPIPPDDVLDIRWEAVQDCLHEIDIDDLKQVADKFLMRVHVEHLLRDPRCIKR